MGKDSPESSHPYPHYLLFEPKDVHSVKDLQILVMLTVYFALYYLVGHTLTQ